MRSLVGLFLVPNFLPLFCIVDLETSHGLMPAAGELMMRKQITMPGVEHSLQIIGLDLCFLVLWIRRSMVLQDSHKMKGAGIL